MSEEGQRMWNTIWNVIQTYVSFFEVLEFALLGFVFFIASSPHKARSNSRSYVRVVSRIGLVLMTGGLSFFIITGIPFFWNSPAQPASGNFISDTDISGLTITTSWSIDQATHSSTTVDVAILPTSSAFPTAGTSQMQASSQLTPVGTPNVPIVQAFGVYYDVSAETTLDSSAFDISGPQPQSKQSLDQQGVFFTWIVTPKYAGSQVLNVSINGIWSPKGGGKEIEYPLAGHELDVEVTEATPTSLLDFRHAVLGGLLVTMAGLIMNLPLAWVTLKKRREEKSIIASPVKTMQATVGERCDNSSTVVGQPNKITIQETGMLQSNVEEKLTQCINIYISCASSSKDERLLDELKKQLSLLTRQPDICLWEKRFIRGGEDRKQVISLYVSQAHLILLLLSPDFFEECYEELELTSKEMAARNVLVIPLLMRPCAWEQTFLKELQPLPRDGNPIRHPNRERAMSEFAKHIQHTVEQIRQNLVSEDS